MRPRFKVLALVSVAVLPLLLAAGPGVSVRDLAAAKSAASAAKSKAQASRDATAKALADADSALVAATADDVTADKRLGLALAKTGPELVGGFVFEPTADGGYRAFQPGDGSDAVDFGDPAPPDAAVVPPVVAPVAAPAAPPVVAPAAPAVPPVVAPPVVAPPVPGALPTPRKVTDARTANQKKLLASINARRARQGHEPRTLEDLFPSPPSGLVSR